MNENKISPENLRMLLQEQAQRFLRMDRGQPRAMLHSVIPLMKSPQVLVITGLRRCGKSTLQAQLADACFRDDYHYVNFDDERWTGFQASDFNQMLELLVELFGEKKVFLFDEIQNIPKWELFVRRLHDSGHKVVITGSNASLLSREIGSHLTGRHRLVELFPFSFSEYLSFREIPVRAKSTAQRAGLRKAFREYLQWGGIPDALKYPDDQFCAQLYQDIIYRDIGARYSIDSLKNLRELSLFLISNVGRPLSFNKLRQMLMLGSVNTVKTYVDYLENSWLYFTVNVFSASVKQQQIAAKKLYCIDNGIINQVSFQTSENRGWLLENLAFLHLRRSTSDIFYARNDDGSEVDFLIRKGTKPIRLVQVAADMHRKETKQREVSSLLKAMETCDLKEGEIITLDERELLRFGKRTIHVIPAAEWMSSTGTT